MVKKTLKIYLDDSDVTKLNLKVEEAGFSGRGSLSQFITKISREPIVFLDQNLKKMLRTLDLK